MAIADFVRNSGIVIATKGLQGFVDQLLNTEEYLDYFGDDTVPYQRRRILPQRPLGELPVSQMARYEDHHLNQLITSGQLKYFTRVIDRSSSVYRGVIFLVPIASIALLIATLILVIRGTTPTNCKQYSWGFQSHRELRLRGKKSCLLAVLHSLHWQSR